MGRKKNNLELFWVMSDKLISTDANDQMTALLVIWSFYADRYKTASHDRLFSWVDKPELRRLSRTVWEQLKVSGLLDAKRIGVLSKVRAVIDGVAFDLLKDDVSAARRWHWELGCRIVDKRGPSLRYQLKRDQLDGLSEMDTRLLIAEYLKDCRVE